MPAIETERPPFGHSDWVTELAAQIEPTKEEPNGKIDPPQRPPDPEPAVKPVIPVDGKGGKPGAADGARAGVESGKPADKLAADKVEPGAEPKAADKVDTGEDWETAPKPKGINDKDFIAWKAGRKEHETKLKGEITKRDEQIQLLQAQVKEVETKAQTNEASDIAKAEVERLNKKVEELNQALIGADVQSHPQFKEYYSSKEKDVLDRAKRIVGEDKSDEITRILNLKDEEYRSEKMEAFMSEMPSDLAKQRLARVVDDLDQLHLDKGREIEKARSNKEKLDGEATLKQETIAKQTRQMQEKAFEETMKAAQDPKGGIPMFQLRPDDQEWNEGVSKRIEAVKGLLTAQNIKPEIVAKAAFMAVAFPQLAQVHVNASQQWAEEKKGLEAKIAELSAAQPKGGGSTDNGDKNGNREIKPGTNPRDISRQFAAEVRERLGV